MNGDTDLYLHYEYNVAVVTLLFYALYVNFELFTLLNIMPINVHLHGKMIIEIALHCPDRCNHQLLHWKSHITWQNHLD